MGEKRNWSNVTGKGVLEKGQFTRVLVRKMWVWIEMSRLEQSGWEWKNGDGGRWVTDSILDPECKHMKNSPPLVTLSTYFGTYFIYLPLGNALVQDLVTDVTPASVPKVLLNLYLRWNPTFHLDIKEITSCLTPNHQKIALCCSSLAS